MELMRYVREMSKVLMLWPDITEDIPKMIDKNYHEIVDIKNLYNTKYSGKISRTVRKILSVMNLSTYFFFDDWVNRMEEYDIIIIHANQINRTVPRTLRKKGFDHRIIYWYWNPVCNSISPKKISRKYCELWSFDVNDCKKYDMKYNSTYYFNCLNAIENDVIYDMFFIGRDKGRYETIRCLESEIQSMGYSTNFMIIKNATSPSFGMFSKFLPYKDVIDFVKKSKCIVEFNQEGQMGLSLRVMEAIFYDKKIITNNHSIKNEVFYDENRIFIINDYNHKDIKKFINLDYCKIDDSIKEYYDFKNWISRFVKEVEKY